ncbi:MAG: O-antigen ligase family protein [Caldilineaceae bacterium]|nr:O-antigen ligase family protein [Caldilineaceae bacterium]
MSDSTIQGPSSAAMDSAAINYTNNWQLGPLGADPQEPADPWQEPSGSFTFRYQGSELALALAVGNYWGYLYVTVDGQPANQLAVIAGNDNSQGDAAGYRTFYVPEAQTPEGTTRQWVVVHRAEDPTAIHTVRVEVWRSWGQWPVRGVAVDTRPATARPHWPGISLLLLATWSIAVALHSSSPNNVITTRVRRIAPSWIDRFLMPNWRTPYAPVLASAGTAIIAIAVWSDRWPLTWLGLVLLGWAGVQRPVLWLGALLVGLPFYFSYPLPILPNRALGIIDIGILGGFVLSSGHRLWTLTARQSQTATTDAGRISTGTVNRTTVLILLITSWALIATLEADQVAVALREWRTVFLYAALFAVTIQNILFAPTVAPAQHKTARRLLIGCWLLGGTLVAAVGLWQYLGDVMLIEAEGVQRVRAFYGSPNNLALYLERTFAVALALAIFTRREQLHWGWLAVALLQGAALILTFSKGALLLALPATFTLLWLGGLLLLRRRGESLRMLWWLTAIAVGIGMALLPFAATDRFRQLLNLEQGTGFIRLQLWQSSWQMALDHPWFGVGPDNFLYAYRSIYLLPAAWQEPNLNHPHNWLLDWWTRLGLPGLLLAVIWFGRLAWQQWQQVSKRHGNNHGNDQNREQSGLALGLLAAIAAALAHGLIDASYALPDLMLVWVLMGYLLGPLRSQGVDKT